MLAAIRSSQTGIAGLSSYDILFGFKMSLGFPVTVLDMKQMEESEMNFLQLLKESEFMRQEIHETWL